MALFAAAATVGLLGLAAGVTPAASASAQSPTPGLAPAEAPVVDVTRLVPNPDLRDGRRLGVLFRREALLGADGTLQWLLGTQDRARLAAPLFVVGLDPLTGASDEDTMDGSTAIRHRWRESRGGTIAGVSAAEGGNWFIDRPDGSPQARPALVRFDDRLRVVERRPAPRGVRFTSMVAANRGVVGIGLESSIARGLKRFSDGVPVTYPVLVAGRRVLRQHVLQDVHGAAALEDGSILLTGSSDVGGADPVIVIRPDGRVVRPADRRGRGLAESSGRVGVVATTHGIVMDERASTVNDAERDDDPTSALLMRGRDGHVVTRRTLADLEYPRPAGCGGPDERRRLSSIGVGPDGLPFIRLTCSMPLPLRPDGTRSYPSYADVGTTMIGLTFDLRPRWYRRAEADLVPVSELPNAPGRLCAHDLTGADGRLLTVRCDGRVTATTVPGALPVGRGTVASKRRASGRDARVRIACEGPQGAVCAGRVQVSAGGQLRGSASYVVPARPGEARGTVDRRIDTPSALPARYEARLLPPG